MKALVDLELQVAWRTATGVEVLALAGGVLVSLVFVGSMLHDREALGPVLAPAVLFGSLPWVLLSAHVLDVVEGLSSSRPVSRGRILFAHLAFTGAITLLAGLLGAALLRSCYPEEADRAALLLPLGLTAVAMPLVAQQVQRRRSWLLATVALGLLVGLAPWRQISAPVRRDLFAPPDLHLWEEAAPLCLQAALVLAVGTWAFLRGGGFPEGASGTVHGREAATAASAGGNTRGGRTLAISLLRTAYGSWNSLLLLPVIPALSLYLRRPEHDAYVLCLPTLMVASGMSLPLSGWRSWVHLPMERARALRILLLPPAALILLLAGTRAGVMEGDDRTRCFPVAERHADGSFSVDWSHPQTKELEFREPEEVVANAVLVLERRWGIRADVETVEGAVLAGWPAGGLSGEGFQNDWLQVSSAYERVRRVHEGEIRGVLRSRALADGLAVFLLFALLSRISFHPWRRPWYRILALVPVLVSMMLAAVPGTDLSGGFAPALRDGYYRAFQAFPFTCSALGAAALLALFRATVRAFSRIEWDMLPEDSEGAMAP